MKSEQINICSNLIASSIFKSPVRVFYNKQENNDQKIAKITKSVFEKTLSWPDVDNESIFQLDDCKVPKLKAPHSLEIINSPLIGILNAYQSNHLIIKNSKIENLETDRFLNHLIIENSTIKSSSFQNCKFNSCAIFSKVTFENAPKISNIKFSSCNVDFESPIFRKTDSSEALGSFRALVKACSDAGYEHGVILFHALELKTRYNNHLKSISCFSKEGPEKISSKIHETVTDYGTNLMKPFRWLFWIFCLGFELNASYFFANTGNYFWSKSLILSLTSTLGPLSFALPETYRASDMIGAMNDYLFLHITFNFLQIILCSIIWFLIIFMIRRRYKI